MKLLIHRTVRNLSTAHDLFYRDGIRATGIDRVSKDDLIVAFLEYRHENWMAWFCNALARHGNTLNALVPALAAGGEISRRHKQTEYDARNSRTHACGRHARRKRTRKRWRSQWMARSSRRSSPNRPPMR